MTRLEFSTKNWSGNTLLQQGVKWNGKEFFVFQGDKRGPIEDLIVHRYDEALRYKGQLTVLGGGHGTTCGVIRRSDKTTTIVSPAGSKGIRVFDYQVGTPRPVNMMIFGHVGHCSAVSVNNAKGRLSVRKGGGTQTVTWFDLNAILNGEKPDALLKYSFATPSGLTFQGMYNWGDNDLFSWETFNLTRGSKNYRAESHIMSNDGKILHNRNIKSLVSPKAEPEGYLGYNGKVLIVKKLFGSHRHLVAVD